uniref:Uncharacterized protein n=1 Tax=Ananas comosus var. bracteatus TaxID=296719 RepID=A0A6V7NWP9_ANACO|nr:unnamed protein product [Ananas comosus var. bracteatus]
MFTEGLDEKAINWVKQGSDIESQPRSPLIEKYPLDATSNHSLLYKPNSFLSPKVLPPVKFHSNLLAPRSNILIDSEGEESGKNKSSEEDVVSYTSLSHDSVRQPEETQRNGLVRGASKENLRVEVVGNSHADLFNEYISRNAHDLGTPSAPPIMGSGRTEISMDVESETKVEFEKTEATLEFQMQSQELDEIHLRSGVKSIAEDADLSTKIPSFTTSVQNAWQTFIAYDACFRLCLNAWARNCMEAPEFLRDECMVLRSAFGIQKFLLQSRGHTQSDGKNAYDKEGACTTKGRKVVKQIEIEAEALTCFLELKSSSCKDAPDSSSPVYLKPGTGDSHFFYIESQADAIFVEVQDSNRAILGRATIQVSSFGDCHGQIIRWFPIYPDNNGCIGKLQLSISISISPDNSGSTEGGPAVETLIYDLVLEAAMRAQNFNSKKLHIVGIWNWLLNEFADYYGVSDAYRKLRYLSNIMNVATPTKDCLQLIYDLLLPITKARGDKSLTRQERSILLDCEEQIKKLLATTFENYKSLDELSPTAVQIFNLLYDILSLEHQKILRNYLQTAAAKRCRRHMIETDEFMLSNADGLFTDPMTISAAYLKMKTLCRNISNEIQADIKIHNQHILPSSIDLPNISASLYSTELCKRLRGFLSACPPSRPLPYVAELLIATADFERNLDSWNIRPVHGGVVSRELFHNYIMVWVQDTRLHLLDLCKAEKLQCSEVSTRCSTSPFVERMYDEIKESINEYEVVINRWPSYLLSLESAVADVERALVKTLEKQYSESLMPLRDGIPKMLEKQVQKFTRRQSTLTYTVPNQLGTFLNSVKRILDVLHIRIEDILKSWAAYLTIADGNAVFGEQTNAITVMLRKKYKKHMQAIVEKLISNTQSNRSTRLKRILEETKEAEGESEIRERMQALCMQLTDSIRNLHDVFSSRIFVAICRGFWTEWGRIWYRGSGYALGILDDVFASEMQKLLGNSLQDRDLDPPQSVIDARSILC